MLFQSCKKDGLNQAKEDVALARVFKHQLYSSDLEGMFAGSSSPQDSILMCNAFIEKWVRESLLMQEAEKNIPKDLNIDELVRDYRSSLVKHNYEKLIIELQLDSTISAQDIQQYYNDHKAQFQLEAPLFQLSYLKLPKSRDDLDQVRTWWNNFSDSTDYLRLLDYCSQHANFYILDNDIWTSFNQLKGEIPANWKEAQLTNGKSLNLASNEYLHLLRVNQRLEKGNFAPMPYVREKAERVILHNRKIQLLERKKEEMYERETRLKNVEIYTQ